MLYFGATRRSDGTPASVRLQAMAEASAGGDPRLAFVTLRRDGNQPEKTPITPSALAALDGGREGLLYAECLSVRWARENFPPREPIERIVVLLSWPLPDPLRLPGAFPDWLGRIARGFRPVSARVFTPWLVGVASGTCELDTPEWKAKDPRLLAVARRLFPEPPDQFPDPLLAMGPVGWWNIWSRAVVDHWGEARVRAAPWEAIVPGPDGALLLQATPTPPYGRKPEPLERIAQISEAIGTMPAASRAIGST